MSNNDSLGTALVEDLRARVQFATGQISGCLQQLSEEDVWWRPHDTHNSVANLILHVCGNL